MITAIILSALFILGDIGVTFMSQDCFGQIPRGKRLERIKQSKHYNGKEFENEVPTAHTTKESNVVKNIWKFVTSDRSNTAPDTVTNVIKTDVRNLPQDRDWTVWFGHSSYLMNLSGKKFLIDPVFYKASPVSFIIPMFKGTDIYKPNDMPDIDYLVITHDHWDHLDYETVKELEPRVGKVICALGVGAHFEYWGYKADKLIEQDWWDEVYLEANFKLTYTPARHFSGRDLNQNKTLWTSYMLQTPRRTVWISGDGGYGPHYAKIGEKFKDIDLGILENGQYSEDWALIHTLPKYLGTEMKEINAKRYLTVHHSKFALSKHDYDEPLKNAKKAAEESKKPVLTPQIGEVIYLD